MRILLDVDGVLGDFVAGAHSWASECHGKTFTDEHVTDYNIMTSYGLPDGWPSFIEWLSVTRFCQRMEPFAGAVEFVAELQKLAEVIVVTSPFVGVDHWEADRRRWLEQHFGIANKDLVFCTRKNLVRGHALIDDSLENCEAFVDGSSFRVSYIFDRPWNQHRRAGTTGALIRTKGYGEVLKALEAAP